MPTTEHTVDIQGETVVYEVRRSNKAFQIHNQKTRLGSFSQRTGTLSLNFRFLSRRSEFSRTVYSRK